MNTTIQQDRETVAKLPFHELPKDKPGQFYVDVKVFPAGFVRFVGLKYIMPEQRESGC